MTEVVSIKYKPCGKAYYFAPPEGMHIDTGVKVIVETAKGLEMAECSASNHMVEDTSVVQPLRPVVRIATKKDFDTLEQNKVREKEAFDICLKKIEEHQLDMKLVSTECSFEGNKITFFFTSDGRVDFRELVKDLAAIFHNRIELRQIGVRDEAKMLGGIGICGRPYCCSEFLDDFAPVSTKMAKIQNLSLNPTKISGSCGRLMCCLRFEEEAYEELTVNVPKQGAFVETPDGYGTAVLVSLLRQQIKVALDSDPDNTRVYKAKQVAAVPGGRPKDGMEPPHVLNYNPDDDTDTEEEPAVEDEWATPALFAEDIMEVAEEKEKGGEKQKPKQKPKQKKKESGTESKSDSKAASNTENSEKKKKKRYWHHKPKEKKS